MNLDVLLGFLALYFMNVVEATSIQAGMAVAVWTGMGLLGDLLLIPLLERVRSLSYLRLGAVVELVIFPVFLLAPGFWAKLGPLALLIGVPEPGGNGRRAIVREEQTATWSLPRPDRPTLTGWQSFWICLGPDQRFSKRSSNS